MAKKNNLDKTYIIIAAIIGVAILGYALISRQTKLDTTREQNNLERQTILKQEEQETENDKKLNSCLSTATERAKSGWMNNCENFGSNIEKDEDGNITTCSLPGRISDSIREKEQQDSDRCAELYK